MKRTIFLFLLSALLILCGTALADVQLTLSLESPSATAMYSADDGATYQYLQPGGNTIPGDPSRLKLKLIWDMSGKTEASYTATPLAPGAASGWNISVAKQTQYSLELDCASADGGKLADAALAFTLRNCPATESFTQDHLVWAGIGPASFTVASGKSPTRYDIDDGMAYTSAEGGHGSTITIPDAVVDALSPGEHILRAYFFDNNQLACAEATIIISGNNAPVGVDPNQGVAQSQNTQFTTGTAASSVSATNIFAHLPDTFIFASGAGGWSTEVQINADGTFSGLFHDSDMGDTGNGYPHGTAYECRFSGAFQNVVRISDYEYSMQIASLVTEGTKGEEKITDNVRVITADPYGFDNAGEFRIYLPGRQTADLPEAFLGWVRGESSWADKPATSTLPVWSLYNVGGGMGFYSYQETAGPDVASSVVPQAADSGVSSSHITGTVTVTHTKSVTVRNRPNEDGNNLYRMSPGESAPCVGQAGTGWYAVFVNDHIGYVPNNYVTFSTQGTQATHQEQTLGIVQITSNDFANVRAQPNQDAEWLAGVSPGIMLDCISIAKNGWYCVALPSGDVGYVSNKLCSLQK